MREAFLHFIWRFRYFNQQALFTESGEPLQVLLPGESHTHQGPDFQNARIRLGDQLFEGAVEIHVVTSDWVRHAHDQDPHYARAILHVVWEDDRRGEPPPGNIPILVLQGRVPKLVLHRYECWMKSRDFVPCERQLLEIGAAGSSTAPRHTAEVPTWTETWRGWLETVTVRRLWRKGGPIRQCLEDNRHHWEATTWIWMARAMGLPVNGDAFEAVARCLPVELLARLREQRIQLEALLLGSAGLLNGPFGAGHPLLAHQREYRFLSRKFGLQPVSVPVSFLRMRPAGFPTIRLVQLAGLWLMGVGWFARIREAVSPGELWTGTERLSTATRDKLVINAFAPLLFTYGWVRQEPAYQEKALRWLRETGAEKNAVLTRWRQLGVVARHAADSQALLELKKEYCGKRRCLDCAIGNRWLISFVNNGGRC